MLIPLLPDHAAETEEGPLSAPSHIGPACESSVPASLMSFPHTNSAIDQIIVRILSQLVDSFGPAVCGNARRLEAMLLRGPLVAGYVGACLPIGTLCSGSDIVSPESEVLFSRLGHFTGTSLRIQTMFTCEFNEKKRA